mgnify:CR=1 FL=1
MKKLFFILLWLAGPAFAVDYKTFENDDWVYVRQEYSTFSFSSDGVNFSTFPDVVENCIALADYNFEVQGGTASYQIIQSTKMISATTNYTFVIVASSPTTILNGQSHSQEIRFPWYRPRYVTRGLANGATAYWRVGIYKAKRCF